MNWCEATNTAPAVCCWVVCGWQTNRLFQSACRDDDDCAGDCDVVVHRERLPIIHLHDTTSHSMAPKYIYISVRLCGIENV